MVVAHASRDAFLQFFQCYRRDSGNIETPSLGDRQPDELDEFGFRPDKPFGAMGDGRYIRGEKAAVETPWPPWRGDGAGNKMDRR